MATRLGSSGYMKLPPNASRGRGQPRVWMMRSSGSFVSHSSLTPSAKICGFSRVTPCHCAPRLPQRAARALGQHGDARREVRGGLAAAAVAALPAGGGAHAAHGLPVHEQGVDREAGKDVDAHPLGLVAQPAADLADAGREVPRVVHGRGRGDLDLPVLAQQVDGFLDDLVLERKVLVLELGKELAEGARVHHGAGEVVLAQGAGLVQHGDLGLAQGAAGLGVLLDQARELDGARQPGRAGAHDHHVHLDRLGVGRVGDDHPLARKRRLVADGKNGACGVCHVARARLRVCLVVWLPEVAADYTGCGGGPQRARAAHGRRFPRRDSAATLTNCGGRWCRGARPRRTPGAPPALPHKLRGGGRYERLPDPRLSDRRPSPMAYPCCPCRSGPVRRPVWGSGRSCPWRRGGAAWCR